MSPKWWEPGVDGLASALCDSSLTSEEEKEDLIKRMAFGEHHTYLLDRCEEILDRYKVAFVLIDDAELGECLRTWKADCRKLRRAQEWEP